MAKSLTPGSVFSPQNTTVTRLVILPAFYGREIFMVIFKTARKFSLFRTRRIQSQVAPTVIFKDVLKLFHLRLVFQVAHFLKISPAKPISISPIPDASIHIWRYNPFRALASLIRRLHSSLFSALLLHPLIPSSCNASLWTTSAHLVLGLPTGLAV